MLVIEGKSGKSVELERILKEKSNELRIAVLDTVRLAPFEINNVEHYLIDNEDLADVIDAAKEEYVKEYDCIVFSINLINENNNLFKIKDYEIATGKKVVVTVQNNDMDKVETYRL